MDSHQYDKVDCSGARPFSVSVNCDCVFIDGDSSVQNGWTADLVGEQVWMHVIVYMQVNKVECEYNMYICMCTMCMCVCVCVCPQLL